MEVVDTVLRQGPCRVSLEMLSCQIREAVRDYYGHIQRTREEKRQQLSYDDRKEVRGCLGPQIWGRVTACKGT